MKRTVVIIIIFLLFLGLVSAMPQNNAHKGKAMEKGTDFREKTPYERINPTTDLVYLGAFRVPSYNTNNTSFSYAGQGMCFFPYGNPNHNDSELPGSLFTVGRDPNTDIYRIAEISIPKPVISPNHALSDLPEARYLQKFVDITGGLQHGGLTQGKQTVDVQYMSKNVTGDHDDYLYWPLYQYYLPDYNMLVFGRSRGTNLSQAANHVEGLWRIQNASASSVQKYMFQIPDDFADTYLNGSKLAVGRYRMVNGGSWGPALYAIAPWKYENATGEVPNGTVMNGTRLIFYTGEDAPYHSNYSRMLKNYSHGDEWDDGAWIQVGNKSAIVISGTKLMRRAHVGNGTEYYGEPGPYASRWGSTGKGYHGEPNFETLLFYDPNDIIRVINGEIAPYEVQPYAFFQFEKYIFKPSGTGLGGVAYDPANNYLYVMEKGVGQPGSIYDRSPIVHVFKIIDAHNTPDKEPPTTPENLRIENITNTSITIRWDPSTDNKGEIMYVVYRLNSTPNYNASWLWGINWSSNEMTDPICNVTTPVPIGITTSTEFIDDMAYAFSPPHRYLVRAFDSVMNPSNFSEVLEIGDEPIIQFEPPTPANGTYTNKDFIPVNITVFDVNMDFSNMTVELYNSSGLVQSIYSDNSSFYHNFTSLNPDVYKIKVIARDSDGHTAVAQRTVFLQTYVPELFSEQEIWIFLILILSLFGAVRFHRFS